MVRVTPKTNPTLRGEAEDAVKELRQLATRWKQQRTNLRKSMREFLDNDELWKALGYESGKDCLVNHVFKGKFSDSHLYKLCLAADITARHVLDDERFNDSQLIALSVAEFDKIPEVLVVIGKEEAADKKITANRIREIIAELGVRRKTKPRGLNKAKAEKAQLESGTRRQQKEKSNSEGAADDDWDDWEDEDGGEVDQVVNPRGPKCADPPWDVRRAEEGIRKVFSSEEEQEAVAVLLRKGGDAITKLAEIVSGGSDVGLGRLADQFELLPANPHVGTTEGTHVRIKVTRIRAHDNKGTGLTGQLANSKDRPHRESSMAARDRGQ